MELENFAEALDALVAAGAANYGDGASIEELHRLSSRFESFVTEATAAFEAGEEWAAEGAKTAASAWIATRCRVPRAGRQAPGAPRAGAAPPARVRRGLARGRHRGRRGPGHRLGPAPPHRVLHGPRRGDARRPGGARWASRTSTGPCRYWKQLADPDGADAADEERKNARNVFLEASFTGMWLGQMTLDPVSGSIVAGELNRLEHDLFEADCAEAKERLGRPGRIDELARTSAQRRADALVEMATRSASAPADGIRPAPLFSVFVGYETLHGRICELENGTVLAPSALNPWLDSAYFERAIFCLGNRVDVSVRARLFSGGTRRAIELRDRICTHPYCYEPAESCQGDHIGRGPRVARPPRRTGGCSAASTTACATSASARQGPSASGPRRARPDGAAGRSAVWPGPPRLHPRLIVVGAFETRGPSALRRARDAGEAPVPATLSSVVKPPLCEQRTEQ